MSVIEVFLEVPNYVQAGLLNGNYERIGGVIRETGSKHIVAWLRDGVEVSNVWQDLRNANLLNRALMTFAGTGLLVNLAITAATMAAISSRLDNLTHQLAKLNDEITSQFKRERDVEFKIALRLADNVMMSSNEHVRREQAIHAVRGLYATYEQLLQDFEQAMPENLPLAQHYLVRALYAIIGATSCYLKIEEVKTAKQSLQEDIKVFQVRTRQLVMELLGKDQALFFHPSVSKNDLMRFIRLRQWLIEPNAPETVDIMEIIDELRKDFWNTEFVKDDSDLLKFVTRQPIRTVTHRIQTKLDLLTQAECAVENLQHLYGFDYEIRYLSLSGTTFADWQQIAPPSDARNVEMRLLVFDEPVALDELAG